MSSYTPNIPQPTDDPSDSQDQILQNFQTLQSIYGTTGDHYPWTNTTPTEGKLHAKVTLPGLPTANPPGNALPTPGVGQGCLFAVTNGSTTSPIWRRDNLGGSPQYSLMGVRAFGLFTGAGGTLNAMNLSATLTGVGQFTLTIPASVMDSANFGVIIGTGISALNPGRTSLYSIINATTVHIAFRNASDNSLQTPDTFSVMLMQI